MNNSDTSKPLASFFIAFYNQEQFVKDAVEGALSQDYENLEVILSDDCSSDNTYRIILDLIEDYKGPHKVIMNRNEHNLGISKHFNKIVNELCHGDYLIAGGGDDISMSTRVSESVYFMEHHPKVQSVTFRSLQVDINLDPIECNLGHDLSPNEYSIYTLDDYCNFSDFIIFSGDSRTFRRSLVDFFPPLREGIEEDIEYFVRSFLLGQVGHIRKPLVKRRIHDKNTSKKPQTRMQRQLQFHQFRDDVDYAYSQHMITLLQYDAMIKKIEGIRTFFYDNDDRVKHHFLHKIAKGLSLSILEIKRYICGIF